MNERTDNQETYTKGQITGLLNQAKVFKNLKRYEILRYLCESGPAVWTDILFELRMNPKSVSDHLKVLQSRGMVERAGPQRGYGFRATEYGRRSLNFLYRVADIIEEYNLVNTILNWH